MRVLPLVLRWQWILVTMMFILARLGARMLSAL
jgi:hypothetical protein